MSSNKNKYYEVCENIGGALASFSTSLRSLSEEISTKAKNSQIENAEQFCLTACATYPDGSPLKGEDAILVSDIITRAICDSDFDELEKLQESGFIKKINSLVVLVS